MLKNLLRRSADSQPKVQSKKLPSVEYAKNPHIERCVFICGLHRSGTTLLEQYISAQFDVSVLRANVPENEGQHLQTMFPPAYKHGGPGRFAFDGAMRMTDVKNGDPARIRAQILEEWSPYIVGDSSLLLEKSPPSLIKIPWLRRVFPEAHFIIMVRDPRAVAAATQKWSSTSLEELMMHWNVAHSIAYGDLQQDCSIIRYEDFCASPEKALRLSGIDAIFDKRASQASIDGRFENIENSNEKYFARHVCKFYGAGIWDKFGYSV